MDGAVRLCFSACARMLGMFSGFSTSARRVTGFFQQSRDAW
ncbi:MAG: hypothetical protein ACI8P0_006332, partial [Planctomycetaceae bacterium]